MSLIFFFLPVFFQNYKVGTKNNIDDDIFENQLVSNKSPILKKTNLVSDLFANLKCRGSKKVTAKFKIKKIPIGLLNPIMKEKYAQIN